MTSFRTAEKSLETVRCRRNPVSLRKQLHNESRDPALPIKALRALLTKQQSSQQTPLLRENSIVKQMGFYVLPKYVKLKEFIDGDIDFRERGSSFASSCKRTPAYKDRKLIDGSSPITLKGSESGISCKAAENYKS